jgi:hypothetical protein
MTEKSKKEKVQIITNDPVVPTEKVGIAALLGWFWIGIWFIGIVIGMVLFIHSMTLEGVITFMVIWHVIPLQQQGKAEIA